MIPLGGFCGQAILHTSGIAKKREDVGDDAGLGETWSGSDVSNAKLTSSGETGKSPGLYVC